MFKSWLPGLLESFCGRAVFGVANGLLVCGTVERVWLPGTCPAVLVDSGAI